MISLAFSNCGIEMIAVANFQMLRTRKIAQKLNFWSLVNPKICLGPALRAIFRISAEPRACSMAGVHGLGAWNVGREFWIWRLE